MLRLVQTFVLIQVISGKYITILIKLMQIERGLTWIDNIWSPNQSLTTHSPQNITQWLNNTTSTFQTKNKISLQKFALTINFTLNLNRSNHQWQRRNLIENSSNQCFSQYRWRDKIKILSCFPLYKWIHHSNHLKMRLPYKIRLCQIK